MRSQLGSQFLPRFQLELQLFPGQELLALLEEERSSPFERLLLCSLADGLKSLAPLLGAALRIPPVTGATRVAETGLSRTLPSPNNILDKGKTQNKSPPCAGQYLAAENSNRSKLT